MQQRHNTRRRDAAQAGLPYTQGYCASHPVHRAPASTNESHEVRSKIAAAQGGASHKSPFLHASIAPEFSMPVCGESSCCAPFGKRVRGSVRISSHSDLLKGIKSMSASFMDIFAAVSRADLPESQIFLRSKQWRTRFEGSADPNLARRAARTGNGSRSAPLSIRAFFKRMGE